MHLRLAAVALTLAACGPKPDTADDTGTGTGAQTSSGSTSTGPTATTGSTSSTPSSTTDAPTLTTGQDPPGTTTGDPDVCPGPNNHLDDGDCFCDPGYLWCNLDDPDDLSCCEDIPTTAAAATTAGESTAPAETSATTGAPCPPDYPGFCQDATNLESCVRGELVTTDCAKACIAGDIDGETHDGGFCLMSRQSSTCACCDADACPP